MREGCVKIMLYEQKRIIRREKFNTIDLLVILCGLTAPIGEKMNIYFPYFSKLYVFFGAILSLFYLFGFIINKRYKISISTRTGLYFLLFIYKFFHSFWMYFFSHKSSNIFDYFKIIIFMNIAFILLCCFKSKQNRVDFFVISFNVSFFIIFIFFNTFNTSDIVIRAEGVYKDANAFGLDAVFVLFTSLSLLAKTKTNILNVIIFFASIIAVFLSGSRSAVIGTLLGIFYYFNSMKSLKKKIKLFIVLLIMFFSIILLIPETHSIPIIRRLFFGSSKTSGYMNNVRLEIWLDYLLAWKKYVLIGLDKDYWHLINKYITHNTYLYFLVSSGIFGFIAYLALIWSNLKMYYKVRKSDIEGHSAIFSLFLAMLTISFFFDTLTLKIFWIIWILVINYNDEHSYTNKREKLT